jgi:hypothetical protein
MVPVGETRGPDATTRRHARQGEHAYGPKNRFGGALVHHSDHQHRGHGCARVEAGGHQGEGRADAAPRCRLA